MRNNTSGSCGVGFICDIHGIASHEIIAQGVEAVKNLTHRGAVGADGKTGDGAGILIQLPKHFFLKELKKLGPLPADENALAAGVFFLYRDGIEEAIENQISKHDLIPLAWRDVPTNDDAAGKTALVAKPRIRQLFIDTGRIALKTREVRLYLARRALEKEFGEDIYIPSLSSRVTAYKGMLVATHLASFYPDLNNDDIASAFCLFHQRFSTNTSPDWRLAQPFRVLAHNGEINTIQGNRNWMSTLEQVMRHRTFGDEMDRLLPLLSPDESDSASLDKVVELLVLSGFSPEHAMIMCIPPAWENGPLDAKERAFFEYHSLLMKPWDGPAAVAFTDGEIVGAHMDRNGLRPLRYAITELGLLVLGSEMGMVDLGKSRIKEKGRLGPGETIAVDLSTGTVRFTDQIVRKLAAENPYAEWIEKYLLRLQNRTISSPEADPDITRKQIAFGYTAEEIRLSLQHMAMSGTEPVWSMGDDTPLPPLAERPQILFRYFKQRFSQVTNPPIDPIRESMVMSLRINMGPKRNLLHPSPEHARRFGIDAPVLGGPLLREIESQKSFSVGRIATTYPKEGTGLSRAVHHLQKTAVDAVRSGREIIILTDGAIAKERLAIPSLLALSAAYKALAREKLTHRASIIVETGEARDIHHIACLVGFGASAVHPYLVFRTIRQLCDSGQIPLAFETAAQHYLQAAESGLLKVIARLGISTINSYHAAQLFDTLCLNRDFAEAFFTNTPVTIEAHGLDAIEQSLVQRHDLAYGTPEPALDEGGEMKFRKDGEHHAWSAPALVGLNKFMRSGDYAAYAEFSRAAHARPASFRNLLGYASGNPVSLENMEPEEAILRRFVTGAMSLGSLSPEAHETIAEACNRLGIKSNSGEGGEDPVRYFGMKNSAMKQIASGRFGVTPTYIASAADLEIKIAQGAKPGEGGHLPAIKVTEYVASLRHCTPHRILISPPPHHDIYSIEDLAQLIHDLKQANPNAHVCVKLVSETGVGTVAAGAAKAYADIVQISGCEGGTGAATISSIKNAGSYWEIGLAETQRVLMDNGLREKVRLRVDGGLRTGRDVVIAALLGAEEFGFGTATMVAAGCVMARQCHSNHCPTGIATQDEGLRKKFRGTVHSITTYFRAVAREVREILSEMGVTSLDKIIGRSDLLVASPAGAHRGAGSIQVGPLLDTAGRSGPRMCACARNDNPATSMNDRILEDILPAIDAAKPVERDYVIRNIDRSIPAKINYAIARKYRDQGLPPDTIRLTFGGTAGQSFGAFNHCGVSLTLIGDANDYVGKGMFGGRIAIVHADLAEPHKHVIVGNTVLYGATGGSFYAAGMAGERFAVRNSGATAVIEGTGLHLCEYMTGGTVMVLGDVGYNVGAGMTGGVIYILDRDGSLESKINSSYVVSRELGEKDRGTVISMIELQYTYTGSVLADNILSDFERAVRTFKKVIPV